MKLPPHSSPQAAAAYNREAPLQRLDEEPSRIKTLTEARRRETEREFRASPDGFRIRNAPRRRASHHSPRDDGDGDGDDEQGGGGYSVKKRRAPGREREKTEERRDF
ncbi:hypothetical protein NL676_017296 [Syzygium grande]|nr:hypothetical protein NL676_017296 [Syzygium grande]